MRHPAILARIFALLATAGLLLGVSGAPIAVAADVQKTATHSVNIRAAATTNSKALGWLVRGQTVTAVSSAHGWTRIRFAKVSGYIASRYLAPGAKIAAPASVPGRGAGVTTAALHLRSGPSTSKAVIATLPSGTRVNAMGRSRNFYVEVATTYGRGWLSTRSLARAAGLPTVVAADTTAVNVNVRAGSASTSPIVATLAKGTTVSLTGIEENGRSQVLFAGAARWVVTTLLTSRRSADAGAVSYAVEKGLTPRTIAVHRASLAAFPQVKTYYGYRNDPSSDHYTGNALDIMIPSYPTAAGKALGQQIADWAVANQRVYSIQYVIWNQQIWNVSRAGEGWRTMADRGNDSANHKNHVHVSVQS